jgi:hypothetical protein
MPRELQKRRVELAKLRERKPRCQKPCPTICVPDSGGVCAWGGIAAGIGAAIRNELRIRPQGAPALAAERTNEPRAAVAARTAEPDDGGAVKERLRGCLREQPDRTLAEMGEQPQDYGVGASRSRISQTLRGMGLRLKKSPSTPRNGTRKPTAGAAKSSSPPSPRSRRKNRSSWTRAG